MEGIPDLMAILPWDLFMTALGRIETFHQVEESLRLGPLSGPSFSIYLMSTSIGTIFQKDCDIYTQMVLRALFSFGLKVTHKVAHSTLAPNFADQSLPGGLIFL